MEIPLSFQLSANPSAYSIGYMGNLPKNGNLPIEAKGIPDIQAEGFAGG